MFRKLNNGVLMPTVGLGTFLSKGDECYQAVICALKCGYKMIDTATIYNNEKEVGQAIKDSGVNREDIFITSKVWTNSLSYEGAIASVKKSLQQLDVDYLDLCLLHWPKEDEKNIAAYKGLEECLRLGLVRAIGVSNYQIHHLEHLLKEVSVTPAMNQFELSPYLQQHNLVKFCHENNIDVTAFGSLMKGAAFKDEVLQEIADKYNKNIVNIIVKWGLQRGIFMIPKSVTEQRIIENFNVYDFTLEREDWAKIRTLNKAKRIYSDPDNIDF